jgi:hypothetical protein
LKLDFTNEKEKAVSLTNHADHRDHASTATEISSSDGRGKAWSIPPDQRKSPRLRVRIIERTAIVRFVDASILFEEAAVRAVSQQLQSAMAEESPATRERTESGRSASACRHRSP